MHMIPHFALLCKSIPVHIADIQKNGMSASEAIAKENSALQIYLYE